jgi:hypothetical protein
VAKSLDQAAKNAVNKAFMADMKSVLILWSSRRKATFAGATLRQQAPIGPFNTYSGQGLALL